MTSLPQQLRECGVVGAGGAGFPAYVKAQSTAEFVLANGAECDPLLQCDQRLMESRAHEMVRGVQLAMQATGAKQGIVALKGEYGAAEAALRRAIRPLGTSSGLSLLLMESQYGPVLGGDDVSPSAVGLSDLAEKLLQGELRLAHKC